MFNTQHSRDRVKELGGEPLFVSGKHIRRGAVRVRLLVQEHVGGNDGRGSPERYGAYQPRQPVDDYQHELVLMLCLW